MQSGDGAVAWNTKYSAWEFVHCGICYLPFINPRNPEAPPPVPFWLTECSHVVCNNHLSELSLMACCPWLRRVLTRSIRVFLFNHPFDSKDADQTCRQCADGLHIELMPLQLDVSANCGLE